MANNNNAAAQDFTFEVDFTKVVAPAPVPDGRYNAVISRAEPKVSSKGNPMLVLTWEITDEGEFKGRKIIDNLTYVRDDPAKTMWKWQQVGTALGFPEDHVGSFRKEDFLGGRAVITTAIQQSNGVDKRTGKPYEPRAQVVGYAPEGSLETVDSLLGDDYE